jgi:hypothetical protein
MAGEYVTSRVANQDEIDACFIDYGSRQVVVGRQASDRFTAGFDL